jgi:hypothetical protein
MKITISDKRKVQSIQDDFADLFPFLKIEFFSSPHKVGAPSPKKLIRHPAATIGECRSKHNSGSITITPDMTVSELEQQFNDVYGLSVQVFRQSGKAWLETTVTDSWTLEKQNEQGKMLSAKNPRDGDAAE